MCVCVCSRFLTYSYSSYFKIVKYFIINIVSVLLCLRNFNFISLLSYIYVYMLNQFYIYSIVITIKLNQISYFDIITTSDLFKGQTILICVKRVPVSWVSGLIRSLIIISVVK